MGCNAGSCAFIPQGGSDHYANHRCAGESVTIGVVTRAAVRILTEWIDYDVPEQDLTVSLSRMPAVPKSRFVMRGVRRRPV